ncbi:MAG: glycosyltransferase [Actinomycetes bacterium]
MTGIELTWCVVNTAQRERLSECLDALSEEQRSLPFETEAIVLDNFSKDGSAEMASAHPVVDRVIALRSRRGKAENDSELIGAANGRYCMLLNEDAILQPGATAALRAALEANPKAAAAGAMLLRPDRREQPSAWRFPGWGTVLAGALFLHRRFTVQSGRGPGTIEVDWAQSAAMLLDREAADSVGRLDPGYFVYSDETDLCKRLADAGRSTLHVPEAVAVHHEGLSTGASAQRRIVEFARGRNRYLSTHLGPLQALAMRPLIAFPYLVRAVAATVLPGHDRARYLWHVKATLSPANGSGLREAAAEFNRREAQQAGS